MNDGSREGEAYAVLTDGNELIFFRSEEEYKDGEIAHASDVLGNEYEGVVYSGVETTQWSLYNMPGWCDKGVVSSHTADGQVIAPVSCALWFYWLDIMVACDLEGLDTSKVTDINYMFYSCHSLVSPPDTSHWDTSSVKDMSYVFDGCHSLETPPDTSGWDTSRVEDMTSMFEACRSLVKPPDTSGWDTSNVTDMSNMFSGCESLQTPPDTSRWDTSNVKDMFGMFNCCESLANVPEVQTVVRIKSERDNVALDAGILADTQYLRDVLNNDPSRIDPAGNLNEVEFEEEVERIAEEAMKDDEFRNRLRQAITEDSHLWGRLQDIVDQELCHFVDERVRTPPEPTR